MDGLDSSSIRRSCYLKGSDLEIAMYYSSYVSEISVLFPMNIRMPYKMFL